MNNAVLFTDNDLNPYSNKEEDLDAKQKEVTKKKKAVAKKIAAVMVLVAGITAVVIACKKNKDRQGEKTVSKIQKDLNRDIKISTQNLKKAKTIPAVRDVEIDVENIEKLAKAIKKYKVNSIYRNEDGEKVYFKGTSPEGSNAAKMYRMSNDSLDGTKAEVFSLAQRAAEQAAKEGDYKNAKKLNRIADIAAENIHKRGRKLQKLLGKESVDEYLYDAIKYSYMIEEVCERFDNDLISYESTNELIDAIYEKCV